MIFKVYYQESSYEVPVRENTKTAYVEAETERAVRKKLFDKGYNIEYIEPISEQYLQYEQQSENFIVLEN
ncbi:DUF1447 family protein [Bacillus sp. HMF5848]|uniref:DNA-dependent RNA polymerase subunit epsilon n=1 Tax=Bacillus sp. HMF5848 TaxID=2495421 RepID=UPI000F7BAFF7|nr:RNA polymerase epsilon subunit [Bacillus sp. HMF5848]RSK26864.1 DUF1447 family protein [Bacillus sp. HMF5848]